MCYHEQVAINIMESSRQLVGHIYMENGKYIYEFTKGNMPKTTIKGFNNYTISRKGQVFNLRTGKWVSTSRHKRGYDKVNLTKDKKQYSCLIHRLVAQTFLANPSNYPYVNHIDGDKTNNCVDNLEWCTPLQNIRHYRGLKASWTPIT